jgi:hypothetical protein
MSMKILLVESDASLRNARVEAIQERGHAVESSTPDAALRDEVRLRPDLIIWTDGTQVPPSDLNAPVVLVGSVENGRMHVVLRLPAGVSSARLCAELADMDTGARPGTPGTDALMASLPKDLRDRIEAVLALFDEPGGARVAEDGLGVVVEGRLSFPERWVAVLERLGGDRRILGEEGRDGNIVRLIVRFDRAGLPEGVDTVIRPGDPWPEDGAFAIDCEGATVGPDRFLSLCDRVRQARRRGRDVALIHVPNHLRLCLEAVGRGADLPMRRMAGPRLAPTLADLWR